MGLYDRRIAELSESRRSRRVTDRRRPFAPPPPSPFARIARPTPTRSAFEPILGEAARRRPSMDIQSLLFSRADGWTASKAKEWARSHGYKHGKVDVTDQYVRIRQFSPKGLKVKRTITLGRGIRAVVAREENMAAKRRRSSKKSAAPKPRRRRAASRTREEARRPRRRKAAPAPAPRRRRARRVSEVAEARRPRRRRARRTREEARRPRRTREEARRPRRAREEARRPRRRAPASQMMEARKRPSRRRPRRRMREETWRGDRPGHSKAAKKGWRRRRKSTTRESYATEARRPRRRRRRAREEFAYEARRPRRRKARRTREVMEARRPRRRSYRRRDMHEARHSMAGGNYVAEMAIRVLTAGVCYVLADGVDRFLATYDPSATGAKPTDKFTSDGTGTLANTLNVAATPDWKRGAAVAGLTIIPAFASTRVDNPYVRSTLEGIAVGAGVKGFQLLWSNVLMPLLIGKDTSAPALQKSFIARLYPAEVAAKLNLDAKQTAVSSSGSGALSGAQQPQSGVGDVGPFALAADSPYPTAEAALRKAAGVSGDSPYPTAEAALRKAAGVSGDSPYPSASDALRQQAGVSQPPSYTPGPPPGPGPGPQTHEHGDGCGCVGEAAQDPFLGFIGEPAEESDQASPLMG